MDDTISATFTVRYTVEYIVSWESVRSDTIEHDTAGQRTALDDYNGNAGPGWAGLGGKRLHRVLHSTLLPVLCRRCQVQ